jgi:hypothetical protein
MSYQPEFEAEPADPHRAARSILPERRALSKRESALIDRPDRKRPERQLTVPIFGRPLTFGGHYTFRFIAEQSHLNRFDFFELDDDDADMDGDFDELQDAARGRVPEHDRLYVNQALELDIFFPFTEDVSVYVSGSGAWQYQVRSDHESEGSKWEAIRKESWLYAGNLFDTPFAVQIGRQRFNDDREWWWDDNLDAARLRFDEDTVHMEVGVANQLARISTDDGFIDPEEDDVLRVLGSVNWEWARRQQIGIYALYHHNRSDGSVVGECVGSPTKPNRLQHCRRIRRTGSGAVT